MGVCCSNRNTVEVKTAIMNAKEKQESNTKLSKENGIVSKTTIKNKLASSDSYSKSNLITNKIDKLNILNTSNNQNVNSMNNNNTLYNNSNKVEEVSNSNHTIIDNQIKNDKEQDQLELDYLKTVKETKKEYMNSYNSIDQKFVSNKNNNKNKAHYVNNSYQCSRNNAKERIPNDRGKNYTERGDNYLNNLENKSEILERISKSNVNYYTDKTSFNPNVNTQINKLESIASVKNIKEEENEGNDGNVLDSRVTMNPNINKNKNILINDINNPLDTNNIKNINNNINNNNDIDGDINKDIKNNIEDSDNISNNTNKDKNEINNISDGEDLLYHLNNRNLIDSSEESSIIETKPVNKGKIETKTVTTDNNIKAIVQNNDSFVKNVDVNKLNRDSDNDESINTIRITKPPTVSSKYDSQSHISQKDLFIPNINKTSFLPDKTKGKLITFAEDSRESSVNKGKEPASEFSKDKNFFKTISIKRNNMDFDIKPKIGKQSNSIEDHYKILKLIGKGAFGSVFKVEHKLSGKIRAMKMIDRDNIYNQDDEQKFLKEIEILTLVEHMNIIKIYEYFEDSKRFFLIMEYIYGQELYDYLCEREHLEENHVKIIFKQVMSAVTYLHNNNIIHRDMKPENILVEHLDLREIKDKYNGYYDKKNNEDVDINIKVIDFGTSRYFKKKENMNLVIGSPYYIAPEVLDGSYNEKCDIWSCGVILFVLLSGCPPFDADTREELAMQIKTSKVEFDSYEWNHVSQKAKDLVLKMLNRDVKKRLSAEDVLNHPWLQATVEELKRMETISHKNQQKALSNIKNFYKQDKLQQATVAYITYFLTPSDEIKEMKNLFKSLDKNGDGTLSLTEMLDGFNKAFGAASDGFELKTVLKEMDTNGDGVVTYEEFLRVVVNKNSLINEQNLRLCFEKFDENNDGKLSAEEIKNALGAKNHDYVKALIDLIDENKNNEIDFDEFKQLMDVVLKRENGENIIV